MMLHLEGEKVFGSIKQRQDLVVGLKVDLHKHDYINSCSCCTDLATHQHSYYFDYVSIYYTILGPIKICKQYEVTIGNFPTCICIHFASMMTSSLGGHGKWVH